MSNIRVVLHNAGFRQLRNDPAVIADLKRRAAAVARAAGDGHDHDARTGRTRGRAAAYTVTNDAKKATAATGALLRALSAGR